MNEPSALPDHRPLFENGHLRLKRCRHGVMLYNVNDQYIGAMLDLYGEFSEGEDDVFRQMLQPGMTVVEAGANIGAHTLPIALRVGPRGRVLAFEPQRSVFQILCANLALNGLEQVEPHWSGLASAEGHASVPRLDSTVPQNFGGLSIQASGAGDTVRLVTLDSMSLPACHLIKIDVEGMEIDVIRGAVETIRRHGPVIYTENDRDDRSPALIAQLQALDYRCYWHTPLYVRMPNFFGNPDNKFPGVGSINMLCVPRRLNVTVKGLREVSGPHDDWRNQGPAPA